MSKSAIPTSASVSGDTAPIDALSLFHTIDDLWLSTSSSNPHEGLESHARLFGTEQLHRKLRSLGELRGQFKKRWRDADRDIADFTVTSGHEGLSYLAERLANSVRVRRSAIPRVGDELAAAQSEGNETKAVGCQMRLDAVAADFAEHIQLALRGWSENRSWIGRHIELERDPDHKLADRQLAATEQDCAAAPEPPNERSPNVIIRTGADSWQLTFDGVSRTTRHLIGMDYLAQLLAHPNTPVCVWRLKHGIDAPAERTDEVTDRQTLDSVRRGLDEARLRLEETADIEAREDLAQSIKQMEQYLSRSTKLDGGERHARLQRTELERVREQVGKAIKTALKRIQQCHPTLHEHLLATLRDPTGLTPCYSGAADALPAWQIKATLDTTATS